MRRGIMTISIEFLKDSGRSDVTDKNTETAIEILLAAINDWPSPVENLNDFKSQVSKTLGGSVTKEKIEACVANLNVVSDAWKIESLTQLLDIFNLNKKYSLLEEFITDINLQLG
jgi:hypothetical protein